MDLLYEAGDFVDPAGEEENAGVSEQEPRGGEG
jgi:hypothetical protein